MKRRTFLSLSALAPLSTLVPASWAASSHASVEVDAGADGPTISPHVQGQFIEHLGGVIYDGIWVGTGSKIANVNGIRKEFIDDMKRIRVPNFRWPGGCFADGYHWRDGIGAATRRPRTYNYWQADMPKGTDATETNHFGIHEFMQLCRLTGAAPYLAANMGSGSPQEFHDWVSYCNAPQGTVSLASERAVNGDPQPFGVRWWGVGNESWGCGGDMTPEQYAPLYRRFVTQFPAYEPKPFFVAVGPRGHSKDLDLSWTTGFLEAMKGHKTPVHGLSMHYYTDFRNRPERVATFDARGWYDVLREGVRTEEVIEQHWAAAAKFDPEHKMKFVLDEWGVWYHTGEEIAPEYILSQPLTLRDALHTAISLDIFNRQAGKLAMCNVAQTINCIHSLMLAKGDRYVRTPVYHVFAMYTGHMGAKSVPAAIQCDETTVPSSADQTKMPVLSGSSSLSSNEVTLTLTNVSLDAAVMTRIRLKSGDIREAKGTVLTHASMTAGNSFDHPDEVRPAPASVSVRGGTAEISLPPRSVVSMRLRVS